MEQALDNDPSWQTLDPTSTKYVSVAEQVADQSGETKEAKVTTRLNTRDLALLKQKAAELGILIHR